MTQRTPVIINNGNLEEIISEDTLLQVVGDGFFEIQKDNVKILDTNVLNFKGSGVEAREASANKSFIISKGCGASEAYKHINPILYSDPTVPDDKIIIKPFQVMLPNREILKSTGDITLDQTNSGDLESGYTPSSNSWVYIYVTDDEDYAQCAFLSGTKPVNFGYHPTINAKYVGSARLDSDADFIYFLKDGYRVTYKYIQYMYTSTQSYTTAVAIDCSNYIPPTTIFIFAFSYDSQTGVYYNWFFGANLGSIVYGSVYNLFANAPILLSLTRGGYINSGWARTGINVFVATTGYYEDVDAPRQDVT